MEFTFPRTLLYLLGSLILIPSDTSTQAQEFYPPGYRRVNWCVTGKDEPELHEWPFSQFVWYLKRTNRLKHDHNVRYDLRFFDIFTHQKDLGQDGRLYKTMHVVFKAEKLKNPKESVHEIWEPLPIEGLIIQANSNPYTIGLPTGQFFPAGGYAFGDPLAYEKAEVHCMDCNYKWWARRITCRKRSKIHPEHPTILAWHYLQRSYNTTENIVGGRPPAPPGSGPIDPGALPPAPPVMQTDGRQTQIHSNFRFFSPRCAPTRRMLFTVLVVRSFVRHEYDLFYRGPYEVTVRDQEHQSDLHPSPYFYFYTQRAICHHYSASDLTLEHPKKFPDFEMNYYFDCCIREEENIKSVPTRTLLQLNGKKTVSCYEKLVQLPQQQKGVKYDTRTIATGDESYMCFYPYLPKTCEDSDFEDARDAYDPCPVCKTPPTTTTIKPTPKPNSIYKRTMHGGLMIMTNFCLQPIVIYIARFYKETFNTKQYKGNKSWYWMHLLGGMVSSGMVYFGYFSGGISNTAQIRNHVVIGDTYIITLAICYVTAWGRHKNTVITTIAEFVHGCMGYVTISLALASIVSAPGMKFLSKLFVMLMAITQAFFMIILTCQICLLDKRIGMKPRRRHFPTVEARFDEIRVPGGKFRIIMLMVFSSITFTLSTASTFFE